MYYLVFLIVLGFIIYYKSRFTFWSSRGLKSPTPWLFFGNSIQLLLEPRADIELKWAQKYGRVYGFYQGTKPILAIADPVLLERICIKHSSSFPDRYYNESPYMTHHQNMYLSVLQGADWYRVRDIVKATFTAPKIKRMYRLLDKCCSELLETVYERRGTIIDCKDIMGLYTMNGITSSLFAMKLRLKKTDDLNTASRRISLIDNALRVVKTYRWRLLAVHILPGWLLELIGFTLTPLGPFNDLIGVCSSIIKKRRDDNSNNKRFDDYLQILLDAKSSDKFEVNEDDEKETHHIGSSETELVFKERARHHELLILNDDEVLANTVLFLTVGYDTAVTLLSSAIYALAHHPQVQIDLHRELETIQNAGVSSNDQNYDIDYKDLVAAEYLDCVIAETLRLMSPVLWQDRIAAENYYIEEYKLSIPKGTPVNLCYYAIHHDPQYWNNPEDFEPERFLPQNRENRLRCAYTPFGHGPRVCIGMRFGLTTAKLALARLVLGFEFKPAPGAKFPPETKFALFINSYKELKVIPNMRKKPENNLP